MLRLKEVQIRHSIAPAGFVRGPVGSEVKSRTSAAPEPDRLTALTEASAIAEQLDQAGKLTDVQKGWPDLVRRMLASIR